jgi:hypothetical protein
VPLIWAGGEMALSRQNNSRIPTRSVALRQLAARVAGPPVVRQAAMIVASASKLALMREVRLLRAVEAGPHDFPIAGETAIKCDAHAHDAFQKRARLRHRDRQWRSPRVRRCQAPRQHWLDRMTLEEANR